MDKNELYGHKLRKKNKNCIDRTVTTKTINN